MAEELDPIVKVVGGGGGIAAISYVAWQFYKLIKSDVKQDAKGDNVDARISAFTSTLQTQLDKAITRADNLQFELSKLQITNADLSSKNSTAQARAEFLASENQRLRDELILLRKSTESVKNG